MKVNATAILEVNLNERDVKDLAIKLIDEKLIGSHKYGVPFYSKDLGAFLVEADEFGTSEFYQVSVKDNKDLEALLHVRNMLVHMGSKTGNLSDSFSYEKVTNKLREARQQNLAMSKA